MCGCCLRLCLKRFLYVHHICVFPRFYFLLNIKREYWKIVDGGIDISYATMHRYYVTIGIYNVDSYLKPHLSLRQMVRRINSVLALITAHNRHVPTFGSRPIDVDKKWFYVILLKKIRLCAGDDYLRDDTA